jgi:putative transposase
MEEYKIYAHTPPHLYQACAKYFITASTYGRKRLLDDPAKERLFSSLLRACDKYGWKLDDWVILDNHYHIMTTAPNAEVNLSTFVAEYHKFAALFVKKNNAAARNVPKIFNNYWDTCITYENSYFARLNYIYCNPVKHNYVKNAEEYPWGSFYFRHRSDGAYIEGLMKKFPFDEVKIEDAY